MGSWFYGLIRGLFALLDKIVVWAIDVLYNLIIQISEVKIFSDTTLSAFANRITLILSVFMIFKLSFSFLNYIVNPDQISDKSKGATKLIQNIAVSLVLLTSYQFLFDKAMDLQMAIIKNNTIPTLILGTNATGKNTSNILTFNLFSAFVRPNSELTDCDNYSADMTTCSIDEYKDGFVSTYHGTTTPTAQLKEIVKRKDTNSLFDYTLALKNGEIFAFDYYFLVSTACGVFATAILLSFCFDIAIRTIKLGFLNLIAPIPIISYIDPLKGEGILKKWLSTVGKTFADLFIRLIAIWFAIFIIQLITSNSITNYNGENVTNPFVVLFVIIGALMFAKQFPKLLQDITGIQLDGKMQLNPLKRLREQTLGGKALVAGGAAVGGAALTGAGNAAHRVASLKGDIKNNGFKKAMFGKDKILGDEAGAWNKFKAGTSSIWHATGANAASVVGGVGSGFLNTAKSSYKSGNVTKGIKEGMTIANTNRTQRELSEEEGATAFGIMGAKISDKLGMETKGQRMKRQVDNIKSIDKTIKAVDDRMESEILKNKYPSISEFVTAGAAKVKYEALAGADVNQIRKDAVSVYTQKKSTIYSNFSKVSQEYSDIKNAYGIKDNESIKDYMKRNPTLDTSEIQELKNKESAYEVASKEKTTIDSTNETKIANEAVQKHAEEIMQAKNEAFNTMRQAKAVYYKKAKGGDIDDPTVVSSMEAVSRTTKRSDNIEESDSSTISGTDFLAIKSVAEKLSKKATTTENSEEYIKAQADTVSAGIKEKGYNNYKDPRATK